MKVFIVILLLLSSIFLMSEEIMTIYIEEPLIINANEIAGEIVKELIIAELENYKYEIVTDSLLEYKYLVKSKIIRFDNNRALFKISMYDNGKLIKKMENVITDKDKIDIFIKRLIKSFYTKKDVKETKEYGTVIAEEEVLSDIEEPFKPKFEVDIGSHLGTIQLSNTINFHYQPIYFGFGASLFKPDYFISIKSLSFVQALGLRVGFGKIFSRKSNSFFIAGDVGAGYFYGIDNVTDPSYFGPLVSFSIGGFLSRTSSVYLKPELRLEFSYRKDGNVSDVIASANVMLSVGF